MTSMDDQRWLNPDHSRECHIDEPADVGLTLRWSWEDLKAEHGESGATKILADLMDAFEANGGQPVTAEQIEAAGVRRTLDDD
ncbi:hypothetical protein EDC02_6115 [Micromonospora sp. Llam0]|nr:hypothetical protein EDC02_6115 [Micromonospora sp. Llam0]